VEDYASHLFIDSTQMCFRTEAVFAEFANDVGSPEDWMWDTYVLVRPGRLCRHPLTGQAR
jgi:hypothetical protein